MAPACNYSEGVGGPNLEPFGFLEVQLAGLRFAISLALVGFLGRAYVFD